jgi:hypothetical protein
MNNLNKIKYWNIEEENKLIEEINNLVDIDDIIKNHDRKITGITMRIEKILNNSNFNDKIKNKNEIIIKYLKNSKPKYYIDYNELYENILDFKSLDEITNVYNKISLNKIKIILTNLLKNKENIDLSKKLRIKSLLNLDDDVNITNEVINKNNENNSDLMSIIITVLNEIKIMKTDIFDIKNRIKIIMDKVEKITNLSNINNNKKFLIKNNFDNEINNNKKIIKKEDICDLNNDIGFESNNKIQIENDSEIIENSQKFIINEEKNSLNKKKKNKNKNIDNIYSDYNDEELEKEFVKYLK